MKEIWLSSPNIAKYILFVFFFDYIIWNIKTQFDMKSTNTKICLKIEQKRLRVVFNHFYLWAKKYIHLHNGKAIEWHKLRALLWWQEVSTRDTYQHKHKTLNKLKKNSQSTSGNNIAKVFRFLPVPVITFLAI